MLSFRLVSVAARAVALSLCCEIDSVSFAARPSMVTTIHSIDTGPAIAKAKKSRSMVGSMRPPESSAPIRK